MKFSRRHLIWLVAICAVVAGCEQDLPRKAAVYDREIVVYDVFEHLEPQFIHGKEIVKSFTAKVVGITDGDTIKVLTGGNTEIKVRLDSIDCPEMDQPYGKKAKQATSDLVFGKMVTIQKTGVDKFGRTLAFVIVDGVNLSEHLIQNGWAWNYEQFSKSTQLAEYESTARKYQAGLWKTPIRIPTGSRVVNVEVGTADMTGPPLWESAMVNVRQVTKVGEDNKLIRTGKNLFSAVQVFSVDAKSNPDFHIIGLILTEDQAKLIEPINVQGAIYCGLNGKAESEKENKFENGQDPIRPWEWRKQK